jgi:tetratricopeptide (TPR) repeat protein
MQREYEIIRNSNDINALFQFTQFNPEHVDSLYAVGEFLRLQGNYPDADNLIQRVIYIYEMAAGYELGEFIKEPLLKKYIIYDATSTSFFMSLFKFMDILGKKGCYRTALEYNKFLLKININDPTACMLCIDFNAISSKQYEFLLKFVQYFSYYVGLKNQSIYLMPNFTYSVALAKFLLLSQPPKES